VSVVRHDYVHISKGEKMKPYVFSAFTGFLAPLTLPLPPLPEEWPAWIQWAIAVASGVAGPAFTWVVARAIKGLVVYLRRRAASKAAYAKVLLGDGDATNDDRALKEIAEADALGSIADALDDESTRKAALAALQKKVGK
jgi:hypothetical protein